LNSDWREKLTKDLEVILATYTQWIIQPSQIGPKSLLPNYLF